MVDDLDILTLSKAQALGYMPNYTWLLGQSANFTKSYVSYSLCCPSRATFLSGQYAHNHGVMTNGDCTDFTRPDSTLATWLEDDDRPDTHEYYTGIIGKYLDGFGTQSGNANCHGQDYVGPGWTRWQALNESVQKVWNYTIRDNVEPDQTYGTTDAEHQSWVLRVRATDFIDDAVDNQIVTQNPFFLYVTPTSPHLETAAAAAELNPSCTFNSPFNIYDPMRSVRVPSSLEGTAQQRDKSASTWNEATFGDKPQFLKDLVPQMTNQAPDHQINCTDRVFTDRLESLKTIDALIGGIALKLNRRGVLGSTVIIFTSDNGFLNGEHRLHSKTLPYEESIRVPLVVRYGPNPTAKTIGDKLVVNTDLAPTIMDLASGCLAEGSGGQPECLQTDGRSFKDFLTGSGPSTWRKWFLLEHWGGGIVDDAFDPFPTFFGIRTGPAPDTNELYVEYFDPATEFELYDLDTDAIQETNDWFSGCCTNLQNQLRNHLKNCGGGPGGSSTPSCQYWEEHTS